jgi:phosphatidylinositol glycan class T
LSVSVLPGYGQEHGGIVTKIHNRHWQPITVVFLENIPWFVPIYLHTLRIVSQGRTIKPCEYIFKVFLFSGLF